MLFHALRISGVVVVSLFLSSCGESDPVSPTNQSGGQPELTSSAHRQLVAVELRRPAKLIDDADGSLIVRLRARCPAGFRAIEGVLSVYQGPPFQEVWGEGFFGGPCNGRWQEQRVRVVVPDGLHPGTARASAQLDVEHPETGEFLQGGDSEVLKIR
jgi:hypothetical protein